jgi:hypothetical protein
VGLDLSINQGVRDPNDSVLNADWILDLDVFIDGDIGRIGGPINLSGDVELGTNSRVSVIAFVLRHQLVLRLGSSQMRFLLPIRFLRHLPVIPNARWHLCTKRQEK